MVKFEGCWSESEKERIAKIVEEEVRKRFDGERAEVIVRKYCLATMSNCGWFKVYVRAMTKAEKIAKEWMKLKWTDRKYLFEKRNIKIDGAYWVFADWNCTEIDKQKVIRELEYERWEEEYIGELRKLGLQFPDGIGLVLDVDKERGLAVVESSNKERYLCSRFGYLRVNFWSTVNFAWFWLFKKELKEMSKEEIEDLLLQRIMSEAFGRGE